MKNISDWTPDDQDLLKKNMDRLAKVYFDNKDKSEEERKAALAEELKKIEEERQSG